MSRNIIIIICVAVALFLTFILGKCSGDGKIIYKDKPRDVIQLSEGQIQIKPVHDTTKIAGKSRIEYVPYPVYKYINGDRILQYQNIAYAILDTNINIGLEVHQTDSLNGIDTTYNRNLRLYLHNKFRFDDSTFNIIMFTEFDTPNFVTKTITKYIEPEPLHWTRSDWFIYAVGTAGFVGGVYIGSNAN